MADDKDNSRNQPPGYSPPDVWTWSPGNGGRFANINRPVSGATTDRPLPVGEQPLQLYSLATPNGVKATIMLEELLAAGHSGAEYDAWLIDISAADQFTSGFVDVNPNSKIPALVDRSEPEAPIRVFESGSILLHLAETFGAFLPTDRRRRAETINWLMWQMGSAPYIGGGFGHFFAYAPFRIEYAIDRFTMETKRILHVLDTRLGQKEHVAGDDYTIADIALFPWIAAVVSGEAYKASKFLAVHEYENVARWIERVGARPAVQRGRMVNRTSGPPETRLRERHKAEDFSINRDDMVEARCGVRV